MRNIGDEVLTTNETGGPLVRAVIVHAVIEDGRRVHYTVKIAEGDFAGSEVFRRARDVYAR
jgi:stress-induced morphogen